MKRVYIGSVVSIFVVISASAPFAAGQAHQNTGHGFGTMLFKNYADSFVLFQQFQAPTNGTSVNQTCGITTGTSEYQQSKSF